MESIELQRGKNKNRDFKKYLPIVLIWLLVLMAYSYLAVQNPDRRSFIAPDESNTFHIAERLVEQGTVYIDSPLNERFDVEIFRGRHFAKVRDKKYTAFNSIGLTLVIALGMKMRITYFILPFLSSLAVIGIYLIVREVANEKAALLAALFYGLFPSNIYHANLLFDAVPAFAMLLLSLGLLLVSFRRPSHILTLLSGICLGITFLLRQSMAIYIFLILVFAVLNHRSLKWAKWLSYFGGAACVALFTIGVNKVVYGSAMASGLTVGSGATPFQALFPEQDIMSIFKSLGIYLLLYVHLLFLLGAAGVVLFYKRYRSRKNRLFLLLMSTMAFISLFIFGSRSRTWGFKDFYISGSMARYYLAIYVFFIIFASIFVVFLARRERKLVFTFVLVSTVVFFSILTFGTFMGIDGMHGLSSQLNTMDEVNAKIREINRPVVIFTKTTDKYFYPDVEVGLVFTQEDVERNPNLEGMYPVIDPQDDVMPIIDELLLEGWRVFIAYDARELLDAMYERAWGRKEYYIKPFDEVWGGLKEVFIYIEAPY